MLIGGSEQAVVGNEQMGAGSEQAIAGDEQAYGRRDRFPGVGDGRREARVARRSGVGSSSLAVVGGLLLLALGAALVMQSAARRPGTPHGGAAAAASLRGLSSLPLPAQGTVSNALGAAERAYRVSAAGGGYRARNPAQRLRTRFDRSGALVESDTAQLGLSLSAVGYGSSLEPLAGIRPRARANRVAYALPGLSEWYSNGPLGVEQGFTIARAPAARAPGPLTLALALSGDMRASRSGDGRSLTFSGPRGSSLRYGDLLASDARGRALHSWLELRGGRVLLRVDARGARYPLRIDPFVQQGAKLAGSGFFGNSVALSADGDTALVGAENASAVWVFTRTGSVWTQQGSTLSGGEVTGSSRFGSSVALSANGNTALIGGTEDNKNVGAAWVFTRSEGKWTQQGAKLTGGEETGEGDFGSSAALSPDGNTALIGGYGDTKFAGAAWVFTRSGEKWAQQGSKLTGGSEEVGEGYFGIGVALGAEGNTALIGASEDNTHVGAAWVFTRSKGTWTQQGAKLTGGSEIGSGIFGYGVALSADGNTALIGGWGDNKAGAAWVFTRSEAKWTQQAKLTGSGEVGAGSFGADVALSGDGNTALVGGEEDNKSTGAVWVFTHSEGKWTQQGAKLTGGEETGAGDFGSSVALSANGETGLIGGPFDNSLKGAAWVFTSGVSAEEGGYGAGNEAEPDLSPACGGLPVNCATGNDAEIQTDLSVGGRGPGLECPRFCGHA